jgi:hypothetical protein
MNVRKLIEKRLRRAGDVHAVVAANIGERGGVTKVSSTQSQTASADHAPSEKRRETAA